jgi:pimeloyl-ACP methyl ester carboxylesterase
MPGFMAGDTSTRLLRRYLSDLGYAAEPWTLGRNLGPHAQLREKLAERVQTLERRHGGPVSLVGWSLGGVYAREIAKQMPGSVRRVVTLGSPFADAGRASNTSGLFDFISGSEVRTTPGIQAILRQPPECPSTSIFSKTDGVVHWKSSLEPETDHTENIEVPGSHCGLGMNPLVLYALADRLHQNPDRWQPFDRTGWRRHLYR